MAKMIRKLYLLLHAMVLIKACERTLGMALDDELL